ncbi:MAG: hypothetical protein KDF59_05320 [Nitrosomonas sp.]|nr:hypothetical protein [Nitrosomonas sp.]
MQQLKERSLQKIEQEFPELKKRYWGEHFGLEDTFVQRVEI